MSLAGPTQLVDFLTRDASVVLDLLAGMMAQAMGQNCALINDCTVVLCPEHMDTLKKGGYASKEQVAHALWRRTNLRYAPCVGSTVYASLHLELKKNIVLAFIVGSLIGFFVRLAACLGIAQTCVPKFSSPESLHIVVAGADAGKFSAFVPGFGIGESPRSTARMSSAVSVEVRPTVGHAQWPLPEPESSEHIVVSPQGELDHKMLALAERKGVRALEEGCTVGLMDINKHNGDKVLDRLEATLRSRFPGISVNRYAKPTFFRPCPVPLREQIVRECSMVVLGLAD